MCIEKFSPLYTLACVLSKETIILATITFENEFSTHVLLGSKLKKNFKSQKVYISSMK